MCGMWGCECRLGTVRGWEEEGGGGADGRGGLSTSDVQPPGYKIDPSVADIARGGPMVSRETSRVVCDLTCIRLLTCTTRLGSGGAQSWSPRPLQGAGEEKYDILK